LGSAAIVSIASLELRDCVRLVNLVEGRSGNQIFGYPNDLEFKSSMTLFAHSAADNKVFEYALQRFFDAQPDRSSLERL
jgi:uncharacterized protein (DUF1810 family)